MSSPAPVVPATDPRLARVRMLARGLDSIVGVPGTRLRVGLDPIIGLVPGIGDMAGAALSGYIVLTGIQLGAPRVVVMRMLANVALDTIAGAVPLFGDVFDAGWKSNVRNVALIERHVGSPDAARKSSTALLLGAGLVLLVLALGGLALTYSLISALVSS